MKVKVLYILFVFSLVLAGCVTAQNQVYQQYETATKAETLAWDKANTQFAKECGKYDDRDLCINHKV